MKAEKKNELISYIRRYKEVKKEYEEVKGRYFVEENKMNPEERERLRKEYNELDVRKDALAMLIADIVSSDMEEQDEADDGK